GNGGRRPRETAPPCRRPSVLGAPPLLLPCRLGGPFRRRLLGAVDEGLEVRAWPELRHRGRGHLDRRTGGGAPSSPGRAVALLEDAESRDGDLVAVGHGRLDGVEDRVQRFGRGLLVPQATRDRVDEITLVHFFHLCLPPREAAAGCAWIATP